METLNTILDIDPNYIIAGLFVLFFTLERILSNPFKFNKRIKHSLNNILLQLVLVIINYFFAFLLIFCIEWLNEHKMGMLYFVELSVWVKLIVSVVIYDAVTYWIHRFTHTVPLLWRFHRVHHSDTSMDSSTYFRFHPLEIPLVFGTGNIITAALFGTDLFSLALYLLLINIFLFLEHSNLVYPTWLDKSIGLLFVTPNIHRVHHEQDQFYTDSNFADIFIIWDRFFGTFKQKPVEQIKYGLKEFDEEKKQSFLYLIRSPFINIKRITSVKKNVPEPEGE